MGDNEAKDRRLRHHWAIRPASRLRLSADYLEQSR